MSAPAAPETALARAARLCPAETIPESRVERLERAIALGVSDAAYVALCEAQRTSTTLEVVLPANRLEGLSRGRGWARQGKGADVVWGERVDGGYRVGPGRWSVGATDGFQRKASVAWDVRHVAVGAETWTVAS